MIDPVHDERGAHLYPVVDEHASLVGAATRS